MKKYDLHKIMKAAHAIKKYMKLYSLTHGVKTWADCMKLAWANEKKRVAEEEAKRSEKESYRNAAPSKRSLYDNLNIPTSAYYNPNRKGRFGCQYVGD